MTPPSDVPLFDADPAPEEQTLTVRELAKRFTTVLQREFDGEIWVRGVIRNLNRSARGHVYFTLAEPSEPGSPPAAAISVVLFDSTRQIVNRQLTRSGAGRFEDGIEIRIRAAVDFYVPQGSLQLRMTAIDPEYTLGRLAADRDRIMRLLAAEDLLDRNAQVPMPVAPLRVTLITSAVSAAAADFHDELLRSGYRFEVRLLDTRVQGETAAESLTHAVMLASDQNGGVPATDVIAIVRGGGSRTDLATFDNEALARAVALCPIPVIVGIGHEIDRSIVDEVAHCALKTPTACANLLVTQVRHADQRFATLGFQIADRARERPAQHEFNVHVLARRLVAATESTLNTATDQTARSARAVQREAEQQSLRAEARLRSAASRIRPSTAATLRAARSLLLSQQHTIGASAPRILRSQSRDLTNKEFRVRALDPVQTLRRGFSITTNTEGTVLRSIKEATDTVITRLADGTMTSTVTSKTEDQHE